MRVGLPWHNSRLATALQSLLLHACISGLSAVLLRRIDLLIYWRLNKPPMPGDMFLSDLGHCLTRTPSMVWHSSGSESLSRMQYASTLRSMRPQESHSERTGASIIRTFLIAILTLRTYSRLRGPILITVTYRVSSNSSTAMLDAMRGVLTLRAQDFQHRETGHLDSCVYLTPVFPSMNLPIDWVYSDLLCNLFQLNTFLRYSQSPQSTPCPA